MSTQIQILPRLIRLKDAPSYLGMDRNRFNKEVRAQIIEIPIGKQGIAFDRLDLDAWIEQYKSCSGRSAVNNRGKKLWDAKRRRDFSSAGSIGTLKSKSVVSDFEKALELSLLRKQKGT